MRVNSWLDGYMCAQVCVLHKGQNGFWKQSSTSVVTLHEPFTLLTGFLKRTPASLARLLVSDSKGSFWPSFPGTENRNKCHHTQLWVQGIKFASSWLLSKHLANSSLSWYFKDYSIFIGLVKNKIKWSFPDPITSIICQQRMAVLKKHGTI